MSNHLRTAIGGLIGRLTRVASVVGGGLLATIMLMIVADIFLRRFFGIPVPRIVALSEIIVAAAVYFGMGEAHRADRHVVVTAIVDRVNTTVRRVARALATVVTLAVTTTMLYASIPALQRSVESREVARAIVSTPLWPGRLAVVVGLALLLLAVVEKVLQRDAQWGSAPVEYL